MKRLVLLGIVLLVSCGSTVTTTIVTPNNLGQAKIDGPYNIALTFFYESPTQVTVTNNNDKTVWVNVTLQRGGTLFDTYLFHNGSKTVTSSFRQGDSVTVKVSWFALSAINPYPGSIHSIDDFIRYLGGLAPVDSAQATYT